MNFTVSPGYSWNNAEVEADRINATKLNKAAVPSVSLDAIDGVPIGATVPASGAFTALSASGLTSLGANLSVTGTEKVAGIGINGTTAGTGQVVFNANNSDGIYFTTAAGLRSTTSPANRLNLFIGGSLIGYIDSDGLALKVGGGASQNSGAFTTCQVTNTGGFIASDGSAGFTGTVTTSSLVGKTITIKDGIITSFA